MESRKETPVYDAAMRYVIGLVLGVVVGLALGGRLPVSAESDPMWRR